MAPRDAYSPVPSVAPKNIPTPSIHITTPDVHFTRAIGEAMGELGHGFGVLGGAQREVGAALGSAGHIIAGAGNELFQRAQALQEVQNQTEENQLRTKYDIESGQLFAQYEAKKGEDATGSFNAFVEGQKKLREDYKAKSSNPDVARRFDNATMQMMGRTIFSAARHSATEQKSVITQTSSARIAQENIDVEKNYKDPNQYRQSLDAVRNEIRTQGHVLGQPAEMVKVREQEAINDLALARINGMSKEKPFEALALFDKMSESHDIFGPKAEQLHGTLQERVRQSTARSASDRATNDLRSDHPDESRTLQEREQEALTEVRKVVQDDPEAEQRAIAETNRKYNQWKAGVQQWHRDAMDQIVGGVSGRMSDGNIPKSIDDLLAIPKMGPLYDKLSNKEKAQVRDMIYQENIKGNRVDPLTSMENFGALKGQAATDPDEFLARTANPYDPKLKLNPAERRQLIDLRGRITKDPSSDPRATKWMQYLSTSWGTQMQALGLLPAGKDNAEDRYKFTARLMDSLETWYTTHDGKAPTPQQFNKDIAPELMKYKPAEWFHILKGPEAQEVQPYWKQEPTDEWKEQYKRTLRSQGMAEPDDDTLQRDYAKYLLFQLWTKGQQKPPGK